MNKDRLVLSMSCCDYDRCHALVNGRVQVDGVDLITSPNEPRNPFTGPFIPRVRCQRAFAEQLCHAYFTWRSLLHLHSGIRVETVQTLGYLHPNRSRNRSSFKAVGSNSRSPQSIRSLPMSGFGGSSKKSTVSSSKALRGGREAWRKRAVRSGCR